jgi:hypothetical protein
VKTEQIMMEGSAAAAQTEEKGAEKRRSKRLVVTLPIKVMGVDALREPFTENTRTIMVSCHGCKYEAKHYAPKGSVVTMEVPRRNRTDPPRIAHATVVWLQRPRQSRDPLQIGVEFETPGNIWNVPNPPDDWFPLPGELEPTAEIAEPVPPAPPAKLSGANSVFNASWNVNEIVPLEGQRPASKSAELLASAGASVASVRTSSDQAVREIVNHAVSTSLEQISEQLLQRVTEQLSQHVAQLSETSRQLHQETVENLDARIQQALQNALGDNQNHGRRRRSRKSR